MNNVQTNLAKFFVRELVRSPEGRAHLLNQIAEGEEQGEQRVFDDAIALVEDDKLKKMIRRHREDEIRHGKMFRACIAKTGVEVGPVPAHLDMLTILNDRLDNFFEGGLETDEDLMTAFVILQVIEERACEQFDIDVAAFEALGEQEVADTFREIASDEARHLKYCRAIALRYAEDPQDYERALVRVREVEAKSFREVQQANIDYVLENGLVEKWYAKILFRVMRVLAPRADVIPYTRFYTPVPVPA